MAKSSTRIYTKIAMGNHGIEPTFHYDSTRSHWEINLRPSGPGLHVIYLGDEFLRTLLQHYIQQHNITSLESLQEKP